MSVSNNGNGAPIPAHIVDKLRGREFKTFDEFREALWLEVSQEPELIAQFSEINQLRISQGFTPFAPDEGHYIGPKETLKNFRYIILLLLNMAAAYTILIIYELLPQTTR
ncbi:hypothetical protein MUTS15_12130 [Escherichia coli]|nr:hypothetical protein MUTS15_12130 [Escherichia coli]